MHVGQSRVEVPSGASRILLMSSSNPPLGGTKTFTSTYTYTGISYRPSQPPYTYSSPVYTSTYTSTHAVASVKEGAKSPFGAVVRVLDDSNDKATNVSVTKAYYAQTEDIYAGRIFYITIFAELMLAAIVFGVSRRMPIYAPLVLAALFYMLMNVQIQTNSFIFHSIGDVFVFIFLLALQVQWHEIMTRPKSKRVTRMVWLGVGIGCLLASIGLFYFPNAASAGSSVYCAISLVGFGFMLKGLLKAPDWRMPVVIQRKDQWERFHRLGWVLLGLWTLMLFKKVYGIVYDQVPESRWNVVVYTVPDLLAAVVVFIGVYPGSVSDLNTRNYTFAQQDLESVPEEPFDYGKEHAGQVPDSALGPAVEPAPALALGPPETTVSSSTRQAPDPAQEPGSEAVAGPVDEHIEAIPEFEQPTDEHGQPIPQLGQDEHHGQSGMEHL